MNRRVLVRGLILILTLAGIILLLKSTQFGTSLDKNWIDTNKNWIDTIILEHGIYGDLIFIGAAAIFTGLGLPRQFVAILGGYAFGLILGSVLALCGTVMGCVGAFFYARLLGRELVAAKFPNRVRLVDNFLSENPLTMTLLIRMLPVGSNIAVNLVAGVSSVKPIPFFGGSTLGYIPQTIIFALIGNGFAVEPELKISISIILFIISGLLGMHLYRKYRHGKRFDDDIDREIRDIDNTDGKQSTSET